MVAKSEKTGRDLDDVADGMARWLQGHFVLSEPPEVSFIDVVASGGLSNETLIIGVVLPVEGARELVARLPPPDNGLFPVYDLRKQGEVQRLLAKSGIPAATALAYEDDPKWIGSPFLLMPRLPGRSPPDYPNYVDAGWIKELDPPGQQKTVDNFLYWLARLNQLDIEGAGLTIAARERPAATRLAEEFIWWKDYLTWLAGGRPTADMVEVSRVYAWLESHWPDAEPAPSFLWGDARPGNALYGEDLEICGVVDFENMALGPAEVDFGWWMTFRHNLTAYRGGVIPELPGFPDRAGSIAMFEHHLGRKLRDVKWYELFSAARQGSCMCGIQRMREQRGLEPLSLPPPILPWILEAMGDRLPA